jgi:hypothetical protein
MDDLPRIAGIEAAWGVAIEGHPFILDIDLDVFATQSAMDCVAQQLLPAHPIFHWNLYSMDRRCVTDDALPGENINADLLLASAKRHIAKAVGGRA